MSYRGGSLWSDLTRPGIHTEGFWGSIDRWCLSFLRLDLIIKTVLLIFNIVLLVLAIKASMQIRKINQECFSFQGMHKYRLQRGIQPGLAEVNNV